MSGTFQDLIKTLQTFQGPKPGEDPGFFLGGGALVSCSTSTPINHIVFFFCRIPVVLENRSSSQEGGGVHPLHPPPRSATVNQTLDKSNTFSRLY